METRWYSVLYFIFLGRSWSASELRLKSFEDLHTLWWVCSHERLCLKAEQASAMKRGVKMYNPSRLYKVRKTMARIKQVLHERDLIYNENLKRERVRISRLYKTLKDYDRIPELDPTSIITSTIETTPIHPVSGQKDPFGRQWPVDPKDALKRPSVSDYL